MELITTIQALFQMIMILSTCIAMSVLAVILAYKILKIMKKILLFLLDCFAPILAVLLLIYIFARGAIAVRYNRLKKK